MRAVTPPVIAIDGPAASGKGTIARRAAELLGFHYLDSGALYRLTALKAMRASVRPDDERALAVLAASMNVSFDADVVRLDGDDVTTVIRAEAVSDAASRVAPFPAVRAALLETQRSFRQPPGLVAEGRDMGTIVFPDAALKVFVTASPQERASRRYKQLIEKGNSIRLDNLLGDIRERDARDSTRATAPLRPAAGALVLDTTDLTIDAATAFVVESYRALEGAERR